MECIDTGNRIAAIAPHKCGIENYYFELLKPLNITRVFVYRTVKLFLDKGGVSDHKRSGRPRMVRTPHVYIYKALPNNALTINNNFQDIVLFSLVESCTFRRFFDYPGFCMPVFSEAVYYSASLVDSHFCCFDVT